MIEQQDYIIVGAGSAGCVLAYRLTENPNVRVLLLEAGGEDNHPMMPIPKGVVKLVGHPKFTWSYPVDQSDATSLRADESWIRGKGLGGSSSINGMIYIRGNPSDYERWVERGAVGWGWSTMKAAFRAFEDYDAEDPGITGRGGPLHISTGTFRYPMAEDLLRAGQQMGLTRRDGLNGEEQEAVGYYSYTIANGRRQSAATVFLKPAMQRPNLRVVTGARASRILFEARRAVGVEVRVDAKVQTFRTNGEVILCAGAIESPRLLQISGIGDPVHLARLGVEVIADSPDVGKNVSEHVGYVLSYRMKGKGSINHRYRGLGLARSVLEYAAFGKGPLATGPYEIGAFTRTDPAMSHPNLQLYLGAFSFAPADTNAKTDVERMGKIDRLAGVTAQVNLVQPTSTGTIMAKSSDIDVSPEIRPNWLASEEDRSAAVESIRYVRRYMSQPALALYRLSELSPGSTCESDEQLLDSYQRLLAPGLHAASSCRMGSDRRAVVDPMMRVNGVERLRVVDCSIMPGIPTGNTNGPVMALAWQAANVILAAQKSRHSAGIEYAKEQG